MGMTDNIKYAKILYLADVLEDISAEMAKDFHNKPFCKSIDDIVKDLRDTLNITTATDPANRQEEKVQIKRIENRHMANHIPGMPPSELPRYEKCIRENVVHELLRYIEKEKLIWVRKTTGVNGEPIFTASLIVGIEQEPDIPMVEERITFLDALVKYIDESRQ